MTTRLFSPRAWRTPAGRRLVDMARALLVGATLAALVSLFGCDDARDPIDPSTLPVATVEVTGQEDIPAGGQIQLTATPRSASGVRLTDRSVSWVAADTTVLTVSATGRVTGRRAGQTQVTAISEGRSGSALVRVTTNPLPLAAQLMPSSALAGTGPFPQSIRIYGQGFVPGARALWGGEQRPTTFVDPGQLRVDVYPADLASPGIVQLSVQNPGPGGGVSQALAFTISEAPVAVVRVEPEVASADVGVPVQFQAVLLDAAGGELEGRLVEWSTNSGIAIVDSTGLVIGGVPGYATITATSEGTSGSAQFTSTYPVPAIDSLSPSEAVEGSGDLTLTVWGRNFNRESLVRWDGEERPATFVRGIELRVAIPAADLAQAGTASVTVHNPAPGGGSSGATSFTVVPAVHAVEVSGGPRDVWVGEGAQLTAIPRDRNGYALARPVTWSSSDTSVARVDSAGVVTTHRAGSASIVATAEGTSGAAHLVVGTPPEFDVVYEGHHAGWPELWIQSPGASPQLRRILPAGYAGHDPAVSPDGERIAFVGRGENWNWDIFVVNRDGSGLQRLTSGPEAEDQPAWSPDGTRIVFRSNRESASDIWVMRADGGEPTNLTRNHWRFGAHTSHSPAWATNGRIVFADGDMSTQPFRGVIRSMAPDGSDWRLLLDDPAWSFGEPAPSPDGQYLAVRMSGMQGGGSAVHVYGAEGEGMYWWRLPVPGTAPAWSPDSKWLAIERLSGTGPCTCELWLFNLLGSDHRPISNVPGAGSGKRPSWLPRQ